MSFAPTICLAVQPAAAPAALIQMQLDWDRVTTSRSAGPTNPTDPAYRRRWW